MARTLSTTGNETRLAHDGALAALDGKHVAPSYGGDPVRNPESLPTGRNIYGFDPARVPTQQAWDVGKGVFDKWLAEYQATHEGRSPEKIAFSLWAGETLRHQGIMEAQVSYALGVRPTWDDGGRVTGFEVIPRDELKRPQLDAEPVAVKGVKMEPEAAAPSTASWMEAWGVRVLVLSVVAALVLIGAWRQATRFSRRRD